jgi:hypothetical protein
MYPHSHMNTLIIMMRHEWFRPRLEDHVTEVDRVFVYDPSDTFFRPIRFGLSRIFRSFLFMTKN